MGEKFSWDRLMKKGKAEEDNTISMVPERVEGPVAPLQASRPHVIGQSAPISTAPPVLTPPPTQEQPQRAPLVIDWDQYQVEDQSASLAPIQVSDNPAPVEPTPVQEPVAPVAPAPTPPTNQFWNQLEQQTTAAMNPTPPSDWQNVELTPAPSQTPSESDLMAGTRNPEEFQPITAEYVRPSEEEIRAKTDLIAQSSAWEEDTTSIPTPAFVTESPVAFTPPPAQTENTKPESAPPVTDDRPPFAPAFTGSVPPLANLPAFDNVEMTETTVTSTTQPATQESEPSNSVKLPSTFNQGSGLSALEIPEPKFAAKPEYKAESDDPFKPKGGLLGGNAPAASSPWEQPAPPATTEAATEPTESATVEAIAEPVFAELPPVTTATTTSVWEQAEKVPTETSISESFAPDSPATVTPDLPPIETTTPPSAWDSIPAATTEPEPAANPSPANANDFWANIPGANVPHNVQVPTEPTPDQTTASTENCPQEEPRADVPPTVSDIPEPYTKIEEGHYTEQVERDTRVGDLLLKHKLVAPAQLTRALERQDETNEKLGQILISMGLISERRLLQVLASQKGVSAWHLEDDAPSQDALVLVPHDACKLFQVLPVAVRGDLLLLAMVDTNDQEAISAVRSMANKRIEPVLADEARLAYTIDKAYGIVKEHEANRLEEMVAIAHEQEIHLSDGTIVNPDKPEHLNALIREVIAEAHRRQATSVTIGHDADKGQVYFRIHGRLCPVQSIPADLAQAVLTSAHKSFESEAIPFEIEQSHKVAIAESTGGESFVITFPRQEATIKDLAELGIEAENLKLLRHLTDRPYGLVLITGSARSDKTSTLASLAQEIERSGRVVARATEGESIAEQINLAVTSESEVIVVGELTNDNDIRAAVKAASSGHLILAEITANDAPTAIQQLVACGADPYLLATILTGVWCQAVAPRLCQECREPRSVDAFERDILDLYGMRHITQVYESEGCDECAHTGVDGQIVISEVLPVSADVRHLIAEKASVEKISEQAGFAGYLPMSYDAVTRIIHGEIDFSTAKRIVMFAQRDLSPISRRDSWHTQAS
ncbi:hypothetical protein C0431_03920 [bacterium]|nr:hypothetical protein [bacterium]